MPTFKLFSAIIGKELRRNHIGLNSGVFSFFIEFCNVVESEFSDFDVRFSVDGDTLTVFDVAPAGSQKLK